MFFRTIILYLLVVAAIRIMGKSELSELQPYQLVILIMISDLASAPMETVEKPFINGIIPIFTLVFLQLVISMLTLKFQKARVIVCGRPSILIEKGKIIDKELKSLRININDLVEQLRIKNYHKIEDIEYAILETNGELSVIPVANKQPLTPYDMHIKVDEEFLPVSVILDGKFQVKNYKYINIDQQWLDSQLRVKGIENIKGIMYATVDDNKDLKVFFKY